jgi:hypothetical protein
MASLKKIAVVSFSFGAGIAFIAALIIGGFFWYESKPKPPAPWNTTAITPKYDHIGTEEEFNYLVFYYILQNNTDYDYQISDLSNIVILAKLKRQDSFSGDKDSPYLTTDYPIFIPAGKRLRFGIHLRYPSGKRLKADASIEERKKFRKELEKYVDKKLSNLNGFSLFDEMNRYQIDFPNGWSSDEKQAEKP